MRKKEQSLLNDAVWPLSHLGCFFFFFVFFWGFILDWIDERESEGGRGYWIMVMFMNEIVTLMVSPVSQSTRAAS
ncbi:hypothetical protein QR685DRAFT_531859 [Neurospora intermedia]|uniref:Uncharacterized protein n=1 Tax=Neurospora intermedia TaxID=5142 RepID=A0ABR3D6N0_NEUIN